MASSVEKLASRDYRSVGRMEGWIFAVLAAALLLWLFFPTLAWMNQRFFEENSYYGHGWLIPAAIAFLLWRRRDALAAARPRVCWWGLTVFLAAVTAHLGARLTEVNFISGWALLAALLGLVLFHGGPERFRLAAAPLCLMVFMIPLPGIWLISIAFDLKNISTDFGVAAARFLGVEVIVSGIEVIIPGSPPGEALTIGDPCSGLHSLLSFGSLGGFFALVLPLAPWRRMTVFFAAVLLAPLSNLIRVVALILLRRMVGPQVLAGFWHIALGVVIFLFCFLVFLQVVRWLLE